MWAYVLSAVLSVCGASPGFSGRTAVAKTRNLKVQMSPPALNGRWYTVAPRRKINKRPLLYFWFVFGFLVQKGCTCCTADLSRWDTQQLCVHCRTGFFLSFFGWNLGPAAVCMLSSKVCFNLVSFLCHLLRSGHFLLYFLLPTSTWETFIYTMLFWWFAEIKNVTLQFFQSAHLSAFPLGSEGHMHF